MGEQQDRPLAPEGWEVVPETGGPALPPRWRPDERHDVGDIVRGVNFGFWLLTTTGWVQISTAEQIPVLDGIVAARSQLAGSNAVMEEDFAVRLYGSALNQSDGPVRVRIYAEVERVVPEGPEPGSFAQGLLAGEAI